MVIYSIIIILLTLFYAGLQAYYIKGWKALPIWSIPIDYQPTTKISVLIPARNEATNITACINSILAQTYPNTLFEIIVIDDHSRDKTPDLVRNYNSPQVQLIQLADYVDKNSIQSFKKKAIEIAIKKATGDLIVSTDADCIAQPNWLQLIASFYEKNNLKFIAAPVNFHKEKSIFEQFQSLDFIGMMGITGAGIHTKLMNMCNGANLAYSKAVFYEVKGFEGITEFASGDDMMLMQKIAKRYPNQVGYLKNQTATIFTEAKPTLKGFLNQRIRWSTKSGSYAETQVTVILALVWFFCLSIPLTFLVALFMDWNLFYLLVFQMIIKLIADYQLLSRMSCFFNRTDLLKTFLISSFYHLIYIIAVGFLGGIVKKYEWKGRTVK